MTQKQYAKERERLLKFYERIEKKYIKQQESKELLTALQHEKNQRLLSLAEKFRLEKGVHHG